MSVGAKRYAAWSTAIAGIVGLTLLPVASSYGRVAVQWSIAGWLVTTAIGVAGGSWIVARHGSAGPGFLIAFGVCMLARLAALGVGATVAATRGSGAVGAYLAGLLIGYLPPQAWEMVWLLRPTNRG